MFTSPNPSPPPSPTHHDKKPLRTRWHPRRLWHRLTDEQTYKDLTTIYLGWTLTGALWHKWCLLSHRDPLDVLPVPWWLPAVLITNVFSVPLVDRIVAWLSSRPPSFPREPSVDYDDDVPEFRFRSGTVVDVPSRLPPLRPARPAAAAAGGGGGVGCYADFVPPVEEWEELMGLIPSEGHAGSSPLSSEGEEEEEW